jgi:hypothetical protein
MDASKCSVFYESPAGKAYSLPEIGLTFFAPYSWRGATDSPISGAPPNSLRKPWFIGRIVVAQIV